MRVAPPAGAESLRDRTGRHAPLSDPHLRRASRRRRRQDRPAVGLGAPRPRPWRAALHRPARPLRPDAGRRRPGFARLRQGRDGARRVGDPGRRQGEGAARPRRSTRTCRPARSRSSSARSRCCRRPRELPLPVFGDAGLSGGDAAQLPLPRPAPRQAAPQHHAALGDHRLDPPADDRRRLLRVPDADPDGVLARGRARLPGAVAAAPGQVLRAAAGAAAVQAADHDRGLRPLFPDRAVLPRRGRARRPLAGRVLPARRRDELRRAGGRLPGGRAGAARRCSRSSATASR